MKPIHIAVLTLLLSACTTTKPAQSPSPQQLASEHGYQLGTEVTSIRNYDINGWNYVSNRALIIPARPNKHYLLLLNRPCQELRSTELIGFTSTVNQLTSGFDAVVVHDHPGGIESKCYIDQIFEIDKVKAS